MIIIPFQERVSMMLSINSGTLKKNYKIKNIKIKNQYMRHRLNALGLTNGTKLKIKQRCLFKGPCILEVNGQCLSIRGYDACQIELEALNE